MPYHFYHILHLISIILLVAITFAAFAAPKPENRKKFLMYSGIASLVALVSGFGLLARLGLGFEGWLYIKLAAWLFFSGSLGMVFRKPELIQKFLYLSLAFVVASVLAVEYKPF